MPIEVESPEEYGYDNIRNNLSESSITDQSLASLGLTIPDLTLLYGEHRGSAALRALIAADATNLDADDVLVTSGATMALFIVSTSLLRREDHLVVTPPTMRPAWKPRAPSAATSASSILHSIRVSGSTSTASRPPSPRQRD